MHDWLVAVRVGIDIAKRGLERGEKGKELALSLFLCVVSSV